MPLLNSFNGASNRALGFSNADPPMGPTITPSKTATSITIDYSLNNGAFPIETTQYKVGSGAFITVTGGSFTLLNLDVSTAYTITMKSIDIVGQTSLTSSEVVTTNAETLPSAPATVSASSSTSTSLNISFTDATAGTYPITRYEYRLYIGATAQGEWATITLTNGTFLKTGLTPDVEYTVYVRAVAATTGSTGSNEFVVAQVNPATPTAPTLSFASTSASQRSSAFLSWTDPTYATSYSVYKNNMLYATTSSTSMTVPVSADSWFEFTVTATNRINAVSPNSNVKLMYTGKTNVPYVKENNAIRYVANPNFNYGGDSYNGDVVMTVTLPTITTNDPNEAGYIYINTIKAKFAWPQPYANISGNPSYYTIYGGADLYSLNNGVSGSGGRQTLWKTDADTTGWVNWAYGFSTVGLTGTNAITKFLGDMYSGTVNIGGTVLSGARFSIAASSTGWSALSSSSPNPNNSTINYGSPLGNFVLLCSGLTITGTTTTATTYS